MLEILLSWLVLSLAVWVTAALLPGVHIRGIGSAAIVAGVFGVLNWLLGWLFFFVFGIATLGLAWLLAFITRWIIDAIFLKVTDAVMDDFEIDGFGWALGAAAVMALLGTVAEWTLQGLFG